ncbi:uncharacterized protein Tco_0235765 [Tanacetum coccineum]
MDRRKWTYNVERVTLEYVNGLSEFIKTAEDHQAKTGKARISCSCKECAHFICHDDIETIRYHLFKHGFTNNYTWWKHHGEARLDCNDVVLESNVNNNNDNGGSSNQNINDMLHDAEHNAELDMEKLQQLFVESEKPLHAEDRKHDEKMRHVADASQWKNIDNHYIKFGAEIRNIRFGLSSDGINPFGNMSSRHSTWPVLLCIYNLPPWLCMKRKYIMMSLLIHGPKQPGNDIDVYLEPLIDDMIDLWDKGVEVYDAYKKERFKLFAVIFCTISDFPAYGNLSGYGMKGEKACPVCEKDTHSRWLTNCKKTVYMGHRRSLPESHPYRKKKKLFDGRVERRKMARLMNGHDTLSRVKDIKTIFGKKDKAPKNNKNIWKKKSIFWKLPYWERLQVRHSLDVMHIEKNVSESLIGLLLNIKGKTKDGINARKDMVEMGIRDELAPQEIGNKRTYLPAACYTLSKAEKNKFCQCLHDIKVPSGYSANIKKLVSMKDLKLIVIDPEKLDEWQRDIILTLCQLEMYFPPSFFNVMVHLVSHIIEEIKALGPIFLHYMYPFERYMGFLKGCVRNRSRPEGSIVEGYVSEEVVSFFTSYIDGIPDIGVPESRHESRLEGKGTIGRNYVTPNYDDLEQAHFTVLQNMTSIAPYIHEHMSLLKRNNSVTEHLDCFVSYRTIREEEEKREKEGRERERERERERRRRREGEMREAKENWRVSERWEGGKRGRRKGEGREGGREEGGEERERYEERERERERREMREERGRGRHEGREKEGEREEERGIDMEGEKGKEEKREREGRVGRGEEREEETREK